MKVLIFGPSGVGKTFIANAWQQAGINAFDADQIEGLSNWYDRDRKKVTTPVSADEAAQKQYAFLWSKKFLATFLAGHQDVFMLGGSGNIAHVFELFDRVFFLKIDPQLQRDRLLSPLRPMPYLDFDEQGELVIWGSWFEELAKERHIPFIDASLSPAAIYHIVSQ